MGSFKTEIMEFLVPVYSVPNLIFSWFSYFNFKGDIYLTDSYGHIPSNQACYDYIKDNDNYENIDNYCEKIELEKNKIIPVSQG